MKEHDVQVTAILLQPGAQKHSFKVAEEGPLLEVLQVGAQLSGATLLPSADAPLDLLHDLGKNDEPGPSIENLDTAVGEYLKSKDTTRDFGVELVLAFRVNTRWKVATIPVLSPREILAMFDLNPSEYSLYREQSAELLPIDTPITIERGMALEAQRDGKYGGTLNRRSHGAHVAYGACEGFKRPRLQARSLRP
jgi:hypothetical protein